MKSHPCSLQLFSFLVVRHYQGGTVLTDNYAPCISRGQYTPSTPSFTYGPFTLRLEQWCVCTIYPCVLDPTFDCGWGASHANMDLWTLKRAHGKFLWLDDSPFMTYKCMTVPCGLALALKVFIKCIEAALNLFLFVEYICICGWVITLCGENSDLYPFRLYSVQASLCHTVPHCQLR